MMEEMGHQAHVARDPRSCGDRRSHFLNNAT